GTQQRFRAELSGVVHWASDGRGNRGLAACSLRLSTSDRRGGCHLRSSRPAFSFLALGLENTRVKSLIRIHLSFAKNASGFKILLQHVHTYLGGRPVPEFR